MGAINYIELVKRIFGPEKGETLISMDLSALEKAAIIEMGDELAGKGSYSDEQKKNLLVEKQKVLKELSKEEE